MINVILYLDLHLLICLFPVGAWVCIKELNDERVFIVLYAVFASYFAGVMIRLMLTLTPCVCVLGKELRKEFFLMSFMCDFFQRPLLSRKLWIIMPMLKHLI